MNPSSHRRPVARRAASALTGLAAAAVATLGLTAAPALADECPNAALRAQNNSTQLPDCRAYELVTPVFKEGFPPAPLSSTEGRLVYTSNANYANNGNGGPGSLTGGNRYVGVRSATGWSAKALAPSGPDYFTGQSVPIALSSDLRYSLWQMRRGDDLAGGSDLYVRRPDDVFSRIGSVSNPVPCPDCGDTLFAASDDMSHVVVSIAAAIYPGTVDSNLYDTYEFVGAGGVQPRLVTVDNTGQPIAPGCDAQFGGGVLSSSYHAISGDGRVIFWKSPCAPGLFARVNGTTTINASASQCTRAPGDPGGPCNGDAAPTFQGANAEGTRVYFTTDQQLVNEDTDSTTDLYECDIPAGTPAPVGAVNPCPDLREVSGAESGADVQGITRMSDDGSRVYFVASGVLASNPGANDAAAVAGDDNLYVWQRDAAHPDAETRFVAKLDPADDMPDGGGLWNIDRSGRLAQTTDDGRYLVFATYGALIDHGPQADTDTARDVYRYDAETGALTRLSTDADGNGGNEPGRGALFSPIDYTPSSPIAFRPRGAMTDDGGSVVFTSVEALVSDDTNDTIDTYLWHDGRVSLISSGKPSSDSGFPVGGGSGGAIVVGIQASISPSGRDVFFMTTARLTPNDVDTTFDVYDARIDGGFDQSPPPACVGDVCQGGRSAPPPLSQPGSSSSTGQGSSPQTTPAFSVGKLTATQLGRVAATGKVSLSVTTNAPGRLSAKATAKIAQRSTVVGSAKRAVTKAGSVSLLLTLSKKARGELKRKRKLSVKLVVGQDNVPIAQTVSLKLTQPRTAEKAKKKSSRTTSRHAAGKGGRS